MNKEEIEKSILKLRLLSGLLTGEAKKDYFEDINKVLIYIEQLENKVEEQERLKKILKKDINACKTEIITVQNGRNRNELKGSERRRLASISGRQNEAIRILNLIEGEKE